MDKNTTIAFVLIGAILVLWLYFSAPGPEKNNPKKGSDSTLVKIDTSDTAKETEKKELVSKNKTEELSDKDTLDTGKYFTPAYGDGEIFTVETDNAIYELSTKGADFHKIYLKKFNNWYSLNADDETDYYKNAIQLINYSRGNSYDLSFVSADGKAINTSNFLFSATLNSGNNKVSGEDSLIVSFKLNVNEASYIEKKYTFYGDKYSIASTIIFKGMNSFVSDNTYDVVWENGIRFVEENSTNEANYSNSSVYYGDEQVIFDAESDGSKTGKDFNGKVDWVAVRNKYFAAVMIPQDPNSVEGAYIEGHREPTKTQGMKEYYNARLVVPFRNTDMEQKTFTLFIGPVDYEKLQHLGHHLRALIDFGSFFGLKFIVRPIAEYVLLPLFNFLHLFIPNYGFVIIVFSLIIKFVLYPLTKTSYKSMKKMQLLQPKIAELKEKLKDDPQKLNKETMKLYSTYGVNPAGGCLPMVLQMPIFIALWGLFQSAIELRQQPFISWIKDLSNPDVIYNLGFKLPLFGVQQISGLALLMGVTTFVQQKMTMKDPKQQAMVYVMPVMLTILFMSFPSGLNLYYFMFNVFSIAQQYYINHTHDDMKLEPVKNPSQKKGFMSRLMEAADTQAKSQQKKKK
jgi:YidC/Oxa1 family membrane protein insertase